MVIYDINGNELLSAIITESAEHERELSKSNFVKLSWNSDSKTVIPAGSYIVPFSDNIKYRLLDKYTPSETATGFKYEPEFQHPLMLLSRIPFLYTTTDQDGKVVKQQEWQYDGLITDILPYNGYLLANIGKIDLTVLPYMSGNAKQTGNFIRSKIKWYFNK